MFHAKKIFSSTWIQQVWYKQQVCFLNVHSSLYHRSWIVFGFKIERNIEYLVSISTDSRILAAAAGTGLVEQKVKAFPNMDSGFWNLDLTISLIKCLDASNDNKYNYVL